MERLKGRALLHACWSATPVSAITVIPVAMIDSNDLPPSDFDHDGLVELDDLMIFIDNWTK